MSRLDWKRPDDFKGLEEGERRIKLTVSYDGSFFHGWQSQNEEVTVQSTIEEVLSSSLKEDITLFASGRTDTGVHALGQVCHFDTRCSIKAENILLLLNTRLPKSIRILSSEETDGHFHARFSTMSREYWYLVKNIREMTSFDDKRMHAFKGNPDLDILNSYAEKLFGTHDFTTFASARDLSGSKMRDIYLSRWDSFKDAFGYTVYRYRVASNAFLYHQVRSMVGTMLEASGKKERAEDFQKRLEAKDRSRALKTAPSDGLYLYNVSYDEKKYQWFEEEYGQKNS